VRFLVKRGRSRRYFSFSYCNLINFVNHNSFIFIIPECFFDNRPSFGS